jgi:hypothetical protein
MTPKHSPCERQVNRMERMYRKLMQLPQGAFGGAHSWWADSIASMLQDLSPKSVWDTVTGFILEIAYFADIFARCLTGHFKVRFVDREIVRLPKAFRLLGGERPPAIDQTNASRAIEVLLGFFLRQVMARSSWSSLYRLVCGSFH